MSKDLSVKPVGELEISQAMSVFFKANADAGTDNLGGESAFFPYLKVTEANSKNMLPDGKFAEPGQFYYAPTQEQFTEAQVAIVNISKGFYLKSNPKEPTEDIKKLRKFVQLVGGVILANNQPFVMIVSGTRLNALWEFGKEIKKWTKAKQPIPMFALKIGLKLERISTEYGFNYVIGFTIAKKESGAPMIIEDEGQAQFLLDFVNKIQSQFVEYEHKFSVDPVTLEPVHDGTIEIKENMPMPEIAPWDKAKEEIV